MRRTLLACLALLTVLASLAPAAAEELNFNFVQLSWQQLDFDDVDVDGDGPLLELSVELGPRVHLFAEYGEFDLDFGLETETLRIGAGYSRNMRAYTDWFATLAYARDDVRAFGFGVEEDGYAISVGVRTATPRRRFEVGAELEYSDVEVREDTLHLIGLYNVHEKLALLAGFDYGDDAVAFGAGLRFYFSL